MMDDFIVSMWLGVKGSVPVGSLRCSAVNGLPFTVAIASYRKVLKEELSSLLEDWSRMEVRTLLTVLICRSQTPPM